MHSNAMRWLTRLKTPSRGLQTLLTYEGTRALSGLNRVAPFARSLCSTSANFHQQPTAKSPSSTTEPFNSAKSEKTKGKGSQWTIPVAVLFAAAGTAYLYRRTFGSSADDDVINTSTFSSFTIMRREQISPTAFILTLRPTSWVDPNEPVSVSHEGEDGDDDGDDKKIGFLSKRIQDAWRHGLWSVEIKQPQLQIARHYTPLPPLPSSGNDNASVQQHRDLFDDEEEEQADLRILIRRMDGGEMSNYLSRQGVGDVIWLRGPHLGFDIARRLGTVDINNNNNNNYVLLGGEDAAPVATATATATKVVGDDVQRDVVFLAGGTGIAPALQVAHKLLDSTSTTSNSSSSNGSGARTNNKPRVSILWANRHEADAVGRESSTSDTTATKRKSNNSWFGLWSKSGNKSENKNKKGVSETTNGEPAPTSQTSPPSAPSSSSLERQIRDLKTHHGAHFQISYFVDDEGSFIQSRDLEAALAKTAMMGSASFFRMGENCTWHSPKAVEHLPDDNDAARSLSSPTVATAAASSSSSPSSSTSTYPCTCVPVIAEGREDAAAPCRPGVNLLFVSGPDGFITAYAGAKRWYDGHEMQGAVGGLLGRLRSQRKNALEGWSVLKL